MLWAAALWGASSFGSLNAQTDSITGKVHRINEVQVSASAKRRVLTSASPLQMISNQDIERLAIQDLPDALKRFSGLTVKDYGGQGGMKTVSVRSLGAQHTTVALDGVPLTNTQSGQIDLSRYSMDNLEGLSLEVNGSSDLLRSARMLFGAGTVNMVSRKADLMDRDHRVMVQLRTGSWGYVSPQIRWDQRISESLESSLSAEYMRADNRYRFYLENGKASAWFKRKNNYLTSTRVDWSLLYTPASGGTLSTKAYFYDSYRHLPGQVVYYNETSNQRQTDRNVFLQTTYQRTFSEKWSLRASAKYDYSFQQYSDYQSIYPGGELHDRYHQREYYASGTLLYHPYSWLQVSNALDGSFNNLTTNTGSKPERVSVLDALSMRMGQGRWNLTLGAMVAYYHDRNSQGTKAGESDTNRLTPSMSLSIKPLESVSWYLRASFKDIFRMPSFSELYYDRFGMKTLRPEKARQVDIGTTLSIPGSKGGILEDWSVTVDGYYNHVKDKIIAIPYNMFFWSMTNLGTVEVLGVDVSQTLSLVPRKGHRLTLAGTYTYQHSVDHTNRLNNFYNHQIPYTPRHSGAASLSWENPLLSVALSMTAMTRRWTNVVNNRANRIDGFVDLSASLWREFTFQGVDCTARLDVQNLLNKQYHIVKNYPMTPRGFKATVTINF